MEREGEGGDEEVERGGEVKGSKEGKGRRGKRRKA